MLISAENKNRNTNSEFISTHFDTLEFTMVNGHQMHFRTYIPLKYSYFVDENSMNWMKPTQRDVWSRNIVHFVLPLGQLKVNLPTIISMMLRIPQKYHRYLTTVVTSTWWDFRNTYRHHETRSKLLKVLLSFVARAGSSKSYRGISILLGTFDMLASTLWENLC